MLRDTTDSEPVNKLTVNAEVLFYRLIMKADDYGSFHANPKLVRSILFPLKDGIRETDITRWMAECQTAGLIFFYENSGKSYLRIINFGQRLRNMRNKFPEPTENNISDNSPQLAATRRNSPPEVEVEVEVEVEGQKLPTHTKDEIELFKKFNDWIKKNASRVNQLKQPFTIDEYLKVKQTLSNETVKNLLIAMHNYKPLLTKSVSAYLTILNWSKRENSNDTKQISEQPSINDALKAATKKAS